MSPGSRGHCRIGRIARIARIAADEQAVIVLLTALDRLVWPAWNPRPAMRVRRIMDMHVRPARAEERERLLEVWERSVRATHHFLDERDVLTLKPLVADVLASGVVEWWVLTSSGDEPIGFLGYAKDTIEALFIDPEHRGKGGGTLLVAHAQHLSGGTLAVDVNEQNESAVGFYEALGFSAAGRSPTDSDGRPFPILHMRRRPPLL